MTPVNQTHAILVPSRETYRLYRIRPCLPKQVFPSDTCRGGLETRVKIATGNCRQRVDGPETPGTRPLQPPASRAKQAAYTDGYLRNLSRLLPVQSPAVAAHPKGLAPYAQHFGQLRFAALILILEHNALHVLFYRQGRQ